MGVMLAMFQAILKMEGNACAVVRHAEVLNDSLAPPALSYSPDLKQSVTGSAAGAGGWFLLWLQAEK